MVRRGKLLIAGFMIASYIVSRPGVTPGVFGFNEKQLIKLHVIIENFVNILGGRINFLIERKIYTTAIFPIDYPESGIYITAIVPLLDPNPSAFIGISSLDMNYNNNNNNNYYYNNYYNSYLMKFKTDDGTPVFNPIELEMKCSCCKCKTHENLQK